MSKEKINEMKKFMKIATGNLMEAKKVAPELKKSAKLMNKVVDGLGAEYEELMNGAPEDDWEEREFASHVLEDMQDYQKLVKMLLAGRGKKAAEFYDYLDTAAREFLWDHLEEDEIEFLQKVFGSLGSDWLFADDDYEDDDELDDIDEDDNAALRALQKGREDRRFAVPDHSGVGSGKKVKEAEGDTCIRCRKGTMEEGETMMGKAERCNRCGYQRDLREGAEEEGMGRYDVTVAIDENYPDEIESALPYPEAMRAAQTLAKQFQKGRWQMKTYKMQDAVEWQISWDSRDDEHYTVIRVEPSDELWKDSPFESVDLGSIAESVLNEDNQLWNVVDDEEINAAIMGKSRAVKDTADELGIDVVDVPLAKDTDFDIDDYPEAEDEELGLRFD